MFNSLKFAPLFTLGLLFSFVFFIFFLIMYFIGVFNGWLLVTLTIVVNLLLWAIGPRISDLVYRIFYKAKFFTFEEFSYQYPELSVFIKKITLAYRFAFPKMGYIEDENPTAFTYGSTRNNARIIFTKGLVTFTDPKELEAVIAHELGHIVNRDFIIMAMASTLIQIFYEIYAIFLKIKSNGEKKSALRYIGLISYIFYIIGAYVLLYLSRVREYYADAFSAKETQSPSSLSNALIKIAYGIVTQKDSSGSRRLLESTRALGLIDIKNAKGAGSVSYIAPNDPHILAEVMAFDFVSPWATILELSSTHPLTGKRIMRLGKIAEQLDQRFSLNIYSALERMKIDYSRLKQGFLLDVNIYFLPITLPLIVILSSILLLTPFFWFLIAFGVGLLIKTLYRLPFGPHQKKTLLDLMRDPYKSPMKGEPVILTGQVVGRGIPGYVFSEDMVFQDETGIVFLDYISMWGFLGNLFFALGKLKKIIGRGAEAEGWFFRGISQHVTLKSVKTETGVIHSRPRIWSFISAAFLILLGLLLSF